MVVHQAWLAYISDDLPTDAVRNAFRSSSGGLVSGVVAAAEGLTGILLYISLLEREAEVVVDAGVEALAATDVWRQAIGAIGEAVQRARCNGSDM